MRQVLNGQLPRPRRRVLIAPAERHATIPWEWRDLLASSTAAAAPIVSPSFITRAWPTASLGTSVSHASFTLISPPSPGGPLRGLPIAGVDGIASCPLGAGRTRPQVRPLGARGRLFVDVQGRAAGCQTCGGEREYPRSSLLNPELCGASVTLVADRASRADACGSQCALHSV